MITTCLAVADIAEHEDSLALRRDLEKFSSDAGAKLPRALGVNGREAELRSASYEFSGHCLALCTLQASMRKYSCSTCVGRLGAGGSVRCFRRRA
jgi:hypothetical protein